MEKKTNKSNIKSNMRQMIAMNLPPQTLILEEISIQVFFGVEFEFQEMFY